MNSSEKHKLLGQCGHVYSPSSPIDRLQLFAGRTEQVKRIAKACNTRGGHAVMYGERGVGKTSLAMVMQEIFSDVEHLCVIKINCVQSDTFENVWRKALSEITVIREPEAPTDGVVSAPKEYTLDQFADTNIALGPGEIRQLLQEHSSIDFEIIIVFDEFDRLDPAQRSPFSDTIKDLSDNSVNTTLVLVGIARDVNDLIIEHASISRCLAQILMPPMSRDELGEIITKANTVLGMTIDDDAASLIVGLSQGLPHYTHLLAQESTFKAIEVGRKNICVADVSDGIAKALEMVDQTLRSSYHKGAHGQRKKTLFPQVLLACSMAEVNELSEFSSTDVRGPLREITGKEYDIPGFAPHLDKLSSDPSRGPVLDKIGAPRRFRFRFRNPLLRPFILMKGLNSGDINMEDVDRFYLKRKPADLDSEMLFPQA